MSVGWNPHFGDLERKTIEAWLLHDFETDFYDRRMKLLVVGFAGPGGEKGLRCRFQRASARELADVTRHGSTLGVLEER